LDIANKDTEDKSKDMFDLFFIKKIRPDNDINKGTTIKSQVVS